MARLRWRKWSKFFHLSRFNCLDTSWPNTSDKLGNNCFMQWQKISSRSRFNYFDSQASCIAINVGREWWTFVTSFTVFFEWYSSHKREFFRPIRASHQLTILHPFTGNSGVWMAAIFIPSGRNLRKPRPEYDGFIFPIKIAMNHVIVPCLRVWLD